MTSSEKITFKSKGINIVGNLYLPADFDPSKVYEGIVMTPPFPQVKDQVLGNYGPRLAERGYIALSFDWNSKGESETYQEGFRDDENIPRKFEDLRNAISYLGSLPCVGAINGLGFCGGGGIMASTLVQPFCGIVGSEAETAPCTKVYYDLVTSGKEFHEIPGASHVGFYDVPENMAQVVDIVDAFFKKHPDPIA